MTGASQLATSFQPKISASDFSTTSLKQILAGIPALCAVARAAQGFFEGERKKTWHSPRAYGSLGGVESLNSDNLVLPDLGGASFSRELHALARKARRSSVRSIEDSCVQGVNFHEYKVPMLSLKKGSQFEGFRILHLSDIHLSKDDPWMVRRLQTIADEIPRLKINLVAITGDLADHSPKDIGINAIRELSRIKKQVPLTFFTPGNHDYGAGIKYVKEAVGEAGIEVLVDKMISLGSPDDMLQILGLDDVYHQVKHDRRFFAKPVLKAAEVNADFPVIVLAHSIDSLSDKDYPVDSLVLTGHTHGLTAKGLDEFCSFFLKCHSGENLLHDHNRHRKGFQELGGGICFTSNGLVDRWRAGSKKSHPFLQPAEALVLELASYAATN